MRIRFMGLPEVEAELDPGGGVDMLGLHVIGRSSTRPDVVRSLLMVERKWSPGCSA
jgi:hypothetical protein